MNDSSRVYRLLKVQANYEAALEFFERVIFLTVVNVVQRLLPHRDTEKIEAAFLEEFTAFTRRQSLNDYHIAQGDVVTILVRKIGTRLGGSELTRNYDALLCNEGLGLGASLRLVRELRDLLRKIDDEFSDFYFEFAPILERICAGRTQNIAEDDVAALVYGTFECFWLAGLSRFDPKKSKLITYLYAIFKNLLCDYFRKAKKLPKQWPLDLDMEQHIRLSEEEARENFLRLIEYVENPKNRRIMELRYIYDFSLAEIANHSDVRLSTSTIHKRIEYCKQEIQDGIDANPFG